MDSFSGFNPIIQQLQQTDTREQIEHCCKAFCQSVNFDNYLMFGSVFTTLLSPPTCVLGSLGKNTRNKKQQLKTITQTCMDSTSPIITGHFHRDSPLNNPMIKSLRSIPAKGISISFPVHYPIGKFAFLHISTNKASNDREQQVLHTLLSGHLFAREAGNAILRLLESELEVKPPYLTPREIECLLLACDGATPQTIAQQVGLSTHTVIHHLRLAREKFGSKHIPGAISKAMLRGMVKTIVDSEREGR